MIDQSILDLIKSRKVAGADYKTIVDELVLAGWENEDINDAFKSISEKENPILVKQVKGRKLFDKEAFLVMPIQIFCLVFTFLLCLASNGGGCSTGVTVTEIILFGLPILYFFLSIKESKNIENRLSYLINNLIITSFIPAILLIFISSKI